MASVAVVHARVNATCVCVCVCVCVYFFVYTAEEAEYPCAEVFV